MIEGPDRPRGQSDYYYRRPLDAGEMLPAVAVGIGAGLAVFYVARLLLQRTPLMREEMVAATGTGGGVVRRPRRSADG